MTTIHAAAVEILTQPDPRAKAEASHATAGAWRRGVLNEVTSHCPTPPARPARPEHPRLVPPAAVPKRKITQGVKGRIALVHALAHIELNAIDLAWDLIARFTDRALPRGFYDDWVDVADEEARHFIMLADRLEELGAAYGDLPAHDGLWQAAEVTARDLAARLAIVPLVLEARGLDITPQTIARLEAVGDDRSAAILAEIYQDEIGHVAAGRRWFDHVCRAEGHEPVATFHELVRTYFKGALKRPFNAAAREAAGLAAAFYEPLA